MKKYNFINEKKSYDELNEGIFRYVQKNYLIKYPNLLKKYKGGKEVDAIYNKYINIINQEFTKQGS